MIHLFQFFDPSMVPETLTGANFILVLWLIRELNKVKESLAFIEGHLGVERKK